jgi:hypothetical protein
MAMSEKKDLSDAKAHGFDINDYGLERIPYERGKLAAAALKRRSRDESALGYGPADKAVDILVELAFLDAINEAHRRECKTEGCQECSAAQCVRDQLALMRSMVFGMVQSSGPLSAFSAWAHKYGLSYEEVGVAALQHYERTGEKLMPMSHRLMRILEAYAEEHSTPAYKEITEALQLMSDFHVCGKGNLADIEVRVLPIIATLRAGEHGPGLARTIVKHVEQELSRCRNVTRRTGERGN